MGFGVMDEEMIQLDTWLISEVITEPGLQWLVLHEWWRPWDQPTARSDGSELSMPTEEGLAVLRSPAVHWFGRIRCTEYSVLFFVPCSPS